MAPHQSSMFLGLCLSPTLVAKVAVCKWASLPLLRCLSSDMFGFCFAHLLGEPLGIHKWMHNQSSRIPVNASNVKTYVIFLNNIFVLSVGLYNLYTFDKVCI